MNNNDLNSIDELSSIDELYNAVERISIKSDKCYYPADGKNICRVDESGEVPLIRFKPVEKYSRVSLGFSTRFGGVSKGFLSSLNFGFDRGDKRENVCENYKRVSRTIGGDYRNLVLSDQVHDTKVEYVDRTFAAGEDIEKKFKGIDGMVTDIPGLILATSYADCVPLFFIDPVKQVIGSSHSGWRGTVGFIGDKTIRKMNSCFGSRPEDIICIVGPSICQNCYEVSSDVIDEIKKVYPEKTWKDIFYISKDISGNPEHSGDETEIKMTEMKENPDTVKYQLDLWAANYHQLLLAGLKKENIHISGLCTCCNSSVLFSHRASKGKRGNLNGFIMITP